MSTTPVARGRNHASRDLLSEHADKIAQLQRLMPGANGGGSVATPFTIGDLEVDDAVAASLNEYVAQAWTQNSLPVFSQGVTDDIAVSLEWSDFLVQGSIIFWTFEFVAIGTGTAGDELAVSLPIPVYRGARVKLGEVLIFDDSTGTRHNTLAEATPAARRMTFGDNGAGSGLWGVDPNLALEPDDRISGHIWYRHALA